MPLTETQCEQYRESGFLIFDPGLPDTLPDAVVNSLSGFWGDARPKAAESSNRGRIQGAWLMSNPVWQLAVYPKVLEALQQLYHSTPLPFQTLNFPIGTQQKAHADTIHFNSEPFGMMCGVWVALEDIGPDQGPLVYYPGSHRLPEMNFEDLGLRPSYELYHQYEESIQTLIKEHGLQPEYALMKKGQAAIWAANVLHGGSRQSNRDLSRNSQVTHYYFPGCRYWRPGLRERGNVYFEPNWVPATRAGLFLSRMAYRTEKSRLYRQWRRLRRGAFRLPRHS